MSDTQMNSDQNQRRARVLRTVWTLAAVAVTLYVGFILRAVWGK